MRSQKKTDPAGRVKENRTAEPQARADRGGDCRCKETSEMKPRQLLKLMMSDLAFWKKAEK